MWNLRIDKHTQHYVAVSCLETASVNVVAQPTYQPVVTQRAATELSEKGPSWWAERYGTHFVAGYVMGGQMIGTASISSDSVPCVMAATNQLKKMFEAPTLRSSNAELVSFLSG